MLKAAEQFTLESSDIYYQLLLTQSTLHALLTPILAVDRVISSSRPWMELKCIATIDQPLINQKATKQIFTGNNFFFFFNVQ